MPGVEMYRGLRVVATPTALDAAVWPDHAAVLRLAADEALVLEADQVDLSDPQALVELETGIPGVELSPEALADWMEREAEWDPPAAGFAQGMAAGLPVKLWVEDHRALVFTRPSLASELEARL